MRSSPGACRSTPRLARGEGAVEHVHRAETRHAVVVRPGEPARPTQDAIAVCVQWVEYVLGVPRACSGCAVVHMHMHSTCEPAQPVEEGVAV